MDLQQMFYHPKTIIHIDIDYFYAQVELLESPHLADKPVGVKQQNIVVTCNYVARDFGVKKCMLIVDALKLCPSLILFNGEDLYKYRRASNQIRSFLLSITEEVEKLGFDENFLDVTHLVLEKERRQEQVLDIVGHKIGELNNFCTCGCHRRLCIASQIAFEIREKLRQELGFTSCCGISYNKLLAKMCCGQNKPNQQTTLLPNGTLEFLSSLKDIQRIPGIGVKKKEILDSVNVKTVTDLQNVDVNVLRKAFKNDEIVNTLKNLSYGIDNSAIKKETKPKSVGVESGFQKISVESEIKEKFRGLLQRLMLLMEEDGRIPTVIKVTVRKHEEGRKIAVKETKQSPLPSSLFSSPIPHKLNEKSVDKLLDVIMSLFTKTVNASKSFHVTCLGLSFSKFFEKNMNSSLTSFLLKNNDVSVQSMTQFVSDEQQQPEMKEEVKMSAGCSQIESDSETEPSPKKFKIDQNVGECKVENVSSPSKLLLGKLNLNDSRENSLMNIDKDVFSELPLEIQQEIIEEWKLFYPKEKSNCSKQSLITNYYISHK